MPWIRRESISTGHWDVAALCRANSPLVPLMPLVPHTFLGAQLGPGLLFPSLLMLLSTIPAELRADVPGLAASGCLAVTVSQKSHPEGKQHPAVAAQTPLCSQQSNKKAGGEISSTWNF